MKYYAQYDENDALIAISVNSGAGKEISKDEYARLYAEIVQKAKLVDEVYDGVIAITECPEEWREEIHRRVDKRRQFEEQFSDEISAEEAFSIITGGVAI